GSSLYARDRFEELERNCVAYANIDMPGMRGAADWSAVTAGPDFFDLAARTVLDVTGQRGVSAGRIRAWDQSFQNLGISSLFVWSSQLPPDSPYRTGGGAMPWWWHTEADTAEFCDREVFETDARLYMAALVRLLADEREAPRVETLWTEVNERLLRLEADLSPVLDLSGLRGLLQDGLSAWKAKERSLESSLHAVRLLNRVCYSAREAHLQDWVNGNDFIPGLSEAATVLRKEMPARKRAIVVHYAITQRNRLLLLAEELTHLAALRA
ncbi:MAG: hypothetical protein LBT65_07260, partial [Synergistaceae bacterium]|nr:hypothetical protein [Synergistaceae bacterium]